MTKEQCVRERNSLEYIKRTEWWGSGGRFLCLKKHNPAARGLPYSFARIIPDGAGGYVMGKFKDDNPLELEDHFPVFESAEAIVAEGWEVD